MKKPEPKLPKGVILWEGTAEYMQDSDSNAEDQLSQVLKVSSEECGDGKFYVIETQRWAFDTIEELITVLRDAESRIMK